MGKQGHPLRRRLWLALGAAVAGLVLAELLLRLAQPWLSFDRFEQSSRQLIRTGNAAYQAALERSDTLFWKLKPSVDLGRTGDKYYFGRISDSRGLRNRERAPGVARASSRILALGDSCTFGVGVDQEESWPQQLEELLNSGRKAQEEWVEVMNAGVPGYSSFQGLRALRVWFGPLQPDLLIVCFGWNDSNVWDGRSDQRVHELLAGRFDGPFDGLLHRSSFYLVLEKGLHLVRSHADRAARLPRVGVGDYASNLEAMVVEAEHRDLPIVFLLWPFRSQIVDPREPLTPYQRALKSVAAARKVPLVDLVEALRDEADPTMFLDVGHLDARGLALVARCVLVKLVRERILR